jgi:hypothetical protein
MRKILLICAIFGGLIVTGARAGNGTPGFTQFPVAGTFSGAPKAVRLVSRNDRKFATRLREAGRQKPNFAGHYALASWGCGASCLMVAAIDARTGNVTWLPFTVCCWATDVREPVEFRLHSRLLIVQGSRDESGGGDYYYALDNGKFVLVKAVEGH